MILNHTLTTSKRHSKWYVNRTSFLHAQQTPENKRLSVSSRTVNGVVAKRIAVNSFYGRGKRRHDWVEFLHAVLLCEFERYVAADVQLSRASLRDVSLHVIHEEDSLFGTKHLDNTSNMPIVNHVTMKFFDCSMSRFIIVIRKQSGLLSRSASRVQFIHKQVGYHLAEMKRRFDTGMDQNMVENMDETHFLFDLHNCETLGFLGCTTVNFADVLSVGEGMTLVLRIYGVENAKVEALFMIFKNRNFSYPINGVADNIEGVSYRTGPRGWMDRRVFKEWMKESRSIQKIHSIGADTCLWTSVLVSRR